MNLWQSIILGVVQGITEFLPVSSSGHLVFVQKVLGVKDGALTMDVLLHLGTLVALVIVYWHSLWDIVRHPLSRFARLVYVAVIPTAIIGVLFQDVFDRLFENGGTLGVEFMATGVILWFADGKKSRGKTIRQITYGDACIVGILQGAAILPAISRSGLTITGALFRGFDRELAAHFSFLVSVPVILGATILEVKDLLESTGTPSVGLLPAIAGMVAAALAGYASIRYMVHAIQTKRLRVFSYYVWLVGGFVLFDQFVTHYWF
ncbi:undecaprenyl-diphosphate phosphatase [Fodinisporobacter ferrooxydans]|uniref:Undecaprenyl-diphosphatase n=1 Tax=Fodinisporobacter ferrooxydans TaxID=2901836 RepID=A0ABY4CJS1_9BACL|nr:undecaprenyl-diphosphate phosphatase [Alicyclobacillaceae bacterium MYW30-H2]